MLLVKPWRTLSRNFSHVLALAEKNIFEESSSVRLRRLIGVEPKVIQCAPANRVRIRVLSKRFRVPGNGIWGLSNTPRRAAISSISQSSIVRPAGVLRRSVKTDVAYVNPGAQGYAEGLNSTVEVHVKQGILVVPYASRRVGY